jgi:oligopeptidase B
MVVRRTKRNSYSLLYLAAKIVQILFGVILGLKRQRRAVAAAFPSPNNKHYRWIHCSAMTTVDTTPPQPPVARREEDRVVYAGVAPEGWPKDVPRQSESSKERLMDPPVAIKDPYGWLRDDWREDKEVLAHLEAENEYTEAITQHLDGLRETIYEELVSAIQETDYSVPRPKQDYVYYSRTFEGKSYPVYCRAPRSSALTKIHWDGSKEALILPGEQVYLDLNEVAEGKKYCSIGTIKSSPSQTLLAYSADFTGDEIYQVVVKNLQTGEVVFEDAELETDESFQWGKDDSTLYYMKMDSNHRPYQLYRKAMDSSSEDELLFEEKDDLFWAQLYKSLDGKYLFWEMSSKETSEVWYIDLEAPNSVLECIAPRREKILYEVKHRHGKWWITTNVGGTPNMRLYTSEAKSDCADEWQAVFDPTSSKPFFDASYERALENVKVLDSHVVCLGREEGIPRVWIVSFDDNDRSSVKSMERLEFDEFDESAHDVRVEANSEFSASTIVISYDSMVTPPQTMEISLLDPSQRTLLKAKHVPGYDQDLYECDRLTVLSRDGTTQIPISMVYRKDVMEKANTEGTPVHTHLYGYGSYGASNEANFRSTGPRLPLLDRGVVFVIAHVRGGGEMGRQWYEEPKGAKFMSKKNTFFDFIDVAKWLVHERKLTSPEMLSCEGRSAGGTLIGTSINLAPELFKVAMMGVPFVDMSTMVDASIPLTAAEWVEWGNPNEEKYFQYMMEYSPMDTVKEGATYPACLLTGGLHDHRVQYWEPAKFAATLRHLSGKESGPICLKIDMNAGHISASDRYKYLKELAYDYAFLLDQVGLGSAEVAGK